jgi:cephalosporin-C deacetylase-like acetyl esterase
VYEATIPPIDNPASFYQEQSAGPLKNYWMIGNDDREQSYYLRMYLSCYRAIDYLRQRPGWDSKTLVVNGYQPRWAPGVGGGGATSR